MSADFSRTPSAAESVSEHGQLDHALEALIEEFGGGQWEAEVVRAKGEWAERTGKVYEEDEIFEQRTTAFLEWYAVERPLDQRGVAPAMWRAAERADDQALVAWARSHRSLFVVLDASGPKVRLADLLGGAEFEVEERRRLHGVGEGDILEARLLGFLGKVRFGRTFLYHPAAAREAIVRQGMGAMATGGSRTDAVDLVGRLRVRALRYKHVAAEKVYDMGVPGAPPTGEHRLR